jgi:hypothetical protein
MTSKPSKGGQAITAEVVLLSLIIRQQERIEKEVLLEMKDGIK